MTRSELTAATARAYDASRSPGSPLWNDLAAPVQDRLVALADRLVSEVEQRHREQLVLIKGRINFVLYGTEEEPRG